MKISFDLDGTAFEHTEILRPIIYALKFAGQSPLACQTVRVPILVGILTGHRPHEEHDRSLLRRKGYPEFDFYIARPDDRDVGAWKRQMIKEHGIDLHIDDDDYHGDGVAKLCLLLNRP